MSIRIDVFLLYFKYNFNTIIPVDLQKEPVQCVCKTSVVIIEM